ncbi:MAG TPA: flagellar hook-associated protein FlgK [Bryobacteraceae bacterium]|jgi:flagellar hook-associated protein 1 FlgK|nr:flagellar hook-associated protein FlgK [Bryobacteraceae bacterium]
MPNLLASLSNAGNAMDVFQQALNVIQNNVNNSSTPGYASQSLNITSQPLVVTGGLTGGVASRGLQDSRDAYVEEQVQLQTQSLGLYTAQSQTTGTIQSYFDVTGSGGLPAALNSLLNAFSAWSVTPNDATAEQTVLSSAQTLASSVNGLANSLSSTSQQLDTQISSTVTQINSIAGQIQQYNQQELQSPGADPGAEANLYSALDDLSQLTNFSTVQQSDGTITVMLGGGDPLVIGTTVNQLSSSSAVPANATYPNAPPSATITDAQGNDVTAQIDSGQLGGLLDTRNRVLGGMLGDGQQQGTLNQFAQALADTVNQILQSGTVSTAAGAASGTALFTYDGSNATDVAATLALNSAITPAQLAPVDSSGNANGNANQLANLGNAGNTAGSINGMNLVQYLAQITSDIGAENQTATTNQTTQQQVAAQATSLRNQISGVSLDAQATNVLAFQRAYQASAQVLTVLNSILDTTMNMMTVSA